MSAAIQPDGWRVSIGTTADQNYWHYFGKKPKTIDDGEIWEPLYSASTLESLQRENEDLRQDRDRTARNRDMYKGQVERQAVQIEDFRSETKRLQVGVYVETLPAAHLISVFADDMNERNWGDNRAYIKQQADRIRTALASAGEHHAE